jgi:hypothetical protein
MTALPELLLNRTFMNDFADAEAPCFAMGLVEANGQKTGFLAMRPSKAIPRDALDLGLAFGHRISELQGEMLCQFVFSVYGFEQYSVLVNPADPMVRQVLETMVERQDYFFFILNPDGRASAFRSDLGEENLAGLSDNLPAMHAATTSHNTYDTAVAAFRRAPDPQGTALTWVCRDNPAYLDLDADPMVLPPAG